MTKEIRFLAETKKAYDLENNPSPAKQHAPSWYRHTKKYQGASGNDSNSLLEHVKSLDSPSPMHFTYKNCIPFIDAMTMGYMITLPATIVVIQKQVGSERLPFVHWRTDWPIVDSPENETTANFPRPSGCAGSMFRWINNWKVETPPGYSLLVTHPIHRHDLPFTTITGVVDTDKHVNPIILPFFFKEGFEGEIPVGTPIAQIIPIKRDNWESSKGVLVEVHGVNKIKVPFMKAYKSLWWTRKSYS